MRMGGGLRGRRGEPQGGGGGVGGIPGYLCKLCPKGRGLKKEKLKRISVEFMQRVGCGCSVP